MEQMIASWSMVMVHGLMVAGLALVPKLARCWARETVDPRRASGTFREYTEVILRLERRVELVWGAMACGAVSE